MAVISSPDEKYKKWLLRRSRRVPIDDFIVDMALALRELCPVRNDAEQLTGIPGATIGRLWGPSLSPVSTRVLSRVAVAVGMEERLERHLEGLYPVGMAGWSETTDWCEGCGTFFHPHYADGMCADCWVIVETGEGVPRDVRLARVAQEAEYVPA